jgi:hypothetical protein
MRKESIDFCVYFSIIIIIGSIVLRNLAASHRRFRNLFKAPGKIPLGESSARRKGLCLNRKQHRNTKTNIHASSGIRTHDPSNQAAKTYALDTSAAGTGLFREHTILIFPHYKTIAMQNKQVSTANVTRLSNGKCIYAFVVSCKETTLESGTSYIRFTLRQAATQKKKKTYCSGMQKCGAGTLKHRRTF